MKVNYLLIRGLARRAVRDGRTLGRAYRQDCRCHSEIIGHFAEYADAYDDERALEALAPGEASDIHADVRLLP